METKSKWIYNLNQLIRSDMFFLIPIILKTASKIILFCLARRPCAILENSNTRKLRSEELKTLLISQKFSKEIVTHGIKKAIIPLKVPKGKENKQVLPFISMFSPNNSHYTTKIVTLHNYKRYIPKI